MLFLLKQTAGFPAAGGSGSSTAEPRPPPPPRTGSPSGWGVPGAHRREQGQQARFSKGRQLEGITRIDRKRLQRGHQRQKGEHRRGDCS